MLQGPGENAGVLDLGDGLAVRSRSRATTTPPRWSPFRAPRRESAGSFATSSPWARARSRCSTGLRFAEPGHAFSRAVGGIGAYGNSVGVPTVGGEAVFDEAYRDNCLVNAMCVGLLPVERVMRAKATGSGQRHRPLRCDHRPRRHRRGVGAREPGARRLDREAALGADRRSLHRQEADRGLGRARAGRPRRVAAGLRRGGHRLGALGDGRRATESTSTSTSCRSARRAWSPGR